MGAPMYDYETGQLLENIRNRFRSINEDTNLTEADKKHLKDFYLQNMIAPQARKLLEDNFPNELGGNRPHHRMTPADRRRREAMRQSASSDRTPGR